MRIVRLEARPLTVPLVEPFVIASSRMDATRAALVVARVARDDGSEVARGVGEAAALPPVTSVDQPDLLAHLARANASLQGQSFAGPSQLEALLDDTLGNDPVARAGAESALMDAWARLEGVPVHHLLGSTSMNDEFRVVTDITIPIGTTAHMVELAVRWRERGFRSFKVKVGKDLDDDARIIEALAQRVPDCVLRLDGNGGLAAGDAMTLISIARSADAQLECFEQPCARDDLEGMARVTALAGCPVVADESIRSLDELDLLVARKAASAVNLKLVKHGGLVAAGRIGRAARRAGLKVMVGAMVETRLGLTAMAHVARALGGADFVDLDTALLLRWDPFAGGYRQRGPEITLVDEPGLGVVDAPPSA